VNDEAFALLRYHRDGTLDLFGSARRRAPEPGFARGYAQDLLVQPDGRIVVVGTADSTKSGEDFAVARFEGGGSSAQPPADCEPPEIRVDAPPRNRCLRRDFTARVTVRDASPVRLVRFSVGDNPYGPVEFRKRFTRRVALEVLRRRNWTISVVAEDLNENRSTRLLRFKQCR